MARRQQVTDLPRGGDLQEFTERWAEAGLPKKLVAPITQLLDRSALASRGAAEAEDASAGDCLRWMAQYGFVASAPDETTLEDAARVEGPVVVRRQGEVQWVQ